MKPAVFLDRDGVLTIENGYAIKSFDEMSIFPYAADCVSRIKRLGFLAIVITNQSAVAKGLFSEDELIRMNDRLPAVTHLCISWNNSVWMMGTIIDRIHTCLLYKPVIHPYKLIF